MSSELGDTFAAHRRWLESDGLDGEPLDLARRSLRGADFRGLELAEADLSGADLFDARFGGARLEGADLSSTNLRGADMAGAWLASVELRGADLRDADLTGCDLTGVLLTETDLRGARLDGAVLDHALVDTSVVNPGLLRAVASSEDLTIGSVLLVVNGATVLVAPPRAATVLLHRRRDDIPTETGVHPLLVAVAADRRESPPPWVSGEQPLATDPLAPGSAAEGIEQQVVIDPDNHPLGWLARPSAGYLVGVLPVDEGGDAVGLAVELEGQRLVDGRAGASVLVDAADHEALFRGLPTRWRSPSRRASEPKQLQGLFGVDLHPAATETVIRAQEIAGGRITMIAAALVELGRPRPVGGHAPSIRIPPSELPARGPVSIAAAGLESRFLASTRSAWNTSHALSSEWRHLACSRSAL